MKFMNFLYGGSGHQAAGLISRIQMKFASENVIRIAVFGGVGKVREA